MKYAYFVRPHMGGTYTLFTHLRSGLARHGIDLRWMDVAPARLRPELDEAGRRGEEGSFVYSARDDDEDRARAMLGALLRNGFDGVFINVLADRAHMNLARYLPEHLRRVMIIHNITPGTYAAASAIRDHVHATVGVSERCTLDLVRRHGFDPGRVRTIQNAVDCDAALALQRQARRAGEPLRLLSLGRLEDASKGVFWLPDIVARLKTPWTLSIFGDGPDAAELRQRLSPFGGRVRFEGSVSQAEVPYIMAGHDVMVMPSRFEGLPLSLIEAMAAGCVPVASRLAGVTDTIVREGETGFLFPPGDREHAARRIDRLAADSALLEAMSLRARDDARGRFSRQRMADSYASLLAELARHPVPIRAPLRLVDWSYPGGMRDGLRTHLPAGLKNWLRVARERVLHGKILSWRQA